MVPSLEPQTERLAAQTPIRREWCTRDHLSGLAAISPERKVYVHSQDCAVTSVDVVAFLEHLWREVPG